MNLCAEEVNGVHSDRRIVNRSVPMYAELTSEEGSEDLVSFRETGLERSRSVQLVGFEDEVPVLPSEVSFSQPIVFSA